MRQFLVPVVCWIGVPPGTLIGGDAAFNTTSSLLELFKRHDITDVEFEYRESVYRRPVGPPLLNSVSILNSTVDVGGSLTAALGLPIASLITPHFQGAMG